MKYLNGYNILKFGLLIYSIFAFLGISGMQIGAGFAFLGLVILIFEKKFVKFYLDNDTKKIFISLVLFLVLNIISAILGKNFQMSLIKIIEFYGQVFLMFCLFNVEEENLKMKLLYIIIFFATLQALFGVIQYFTKFDFFRNETLTSRVRGSFSHYNTFGGLLGMITPVVYSFLIYENKLKSKILFLISFVIIFTALIFSSTRGAWLGTVFGISFVSFRKFKYNSFLLILFLLFFLFLPPVRNRLLQTVKEPFGGRKEIWLTTLKMIKERPIFGYGKDNFKHIFYEKLPNFEKGHFHPHNIWLTIAVDSGVISVALFGFIIFYIFKIFLRKIIVLSKNKECIIFGCFGGLIDALIHGLVDNILRGETGYLFWFFVGIISSM